jgi:hypothetical protein
MMYVITFFDILKRTKLDNNALFIYIILEKAGLGQMGTDESEFVRILCSRSFLQLKETFKEYEKISGITIIETINSEMSGDLKRACLAVCEAAQSKSVYFAKQLHECIREVGTKDEDLIRLLATRSEVKMFLIFFLKIRQGNKNGTLTGFRMI